MSKTNTPWKGLIIAGTLFLSLMGGSAWGGSVSGCAADTCKWDISLNGDIVSSGSYQSDSTTGDIIFSGPTSYDDGNGNTLSLNTLSGNIDPILLFGVGASTTAGSTFGFTFNLPIALQGLINANSSVSYSLTSGTNAGAQIAPVGSNIVSAFEVDTTVGGLGSFNKGVDVGNTFFFNGGPATNPSPVYTASNSFTGDLAYDLMTVKVDFSLSANSSVALSGFVQQLPVPIPPAAWLFASGLLGLVGIARRRAA